MRTVEGNVELFKRKSVTHGNLRVFPSQKIHQLQVSAVSISFWVYPCCVLGRWYYYGNRWFFETPKKTEQIDFTQTIKRRIPGCRCTCLKMKMLSCWRSSNFRNVSLKRHVGKNKKKACRKSMGHFNATTCSGGIKLDAQMYGMFCWWIFHKKMHASLGRSWVGVI